MQQIYPEINNHIPNAHIELAHKNTIETFSGSQLQSFIVQDPDIADFLSDIYYWSTPTDYLDEAKQQFNVAFARHHKAHIATVNYDNNIHRWCIQTVTF
jgi:translation initiation factor RLI1